MIEGSDSRIECSEVRGRLHALRRGTLDASDRDSLIRHLDGCPECRHEDDAEALLDRLLRERLPRHEPTPALRRRLAAVVAGADQPAAAAPSPALAYVAPKAARTRTPARALWWARVAVPALAASIALVAGGVLWGRHTALRPDETGRLVEEAIGDHLRVLAAAHPLDIESSASHEVKPWFEGRLDFSPNVPHDIGELRLRGGSVGYFLDRKAAILSYALRRHAVTLVVVPANGLPWPTGGDGTRAFTPRGTRVRGIEAIFWRHGDIGYALIADVNSAELRRVAGDLYRATAG